MVNENLVKVGMADLNIIKGSGILKTNGLGSCVGLTLYDSFCNVYGMAHVMLPSSEITRDLQFNIAKYANTAIPSLIEKMVKEGAVKSRLKAKMAGGAQMFQYTTNSEAMRIGPRNVEACKHMLLNLSIPIIAEDTGGNYGRTIEFYTDKQMLLIRTVYHGIKEI